MERGSIRTLRLARALLSLIMKVQPDDVVAMVIDDTIILRHSKKTPGYNTIRFDHAQKTNPQKYMLSQNWVTLGGSGRRVADSFSSGTHYRQSQQAEDRAGAGACAGTNLFASGASVVRFLVDACSAGTAIALQGNSGDRSSPNRHGIVFPAGGAESSWSGATTNLWKTAYAEGHHRLANGGADLEPLWQGAKDLAAFGDGASLLPQGKKGLRGVMRILRSG